MSLLLKGQASSPAVAVTRSPQLAQGLQGEVSSNSNNSLKWSGQACRSPPVATLVVDRASPRSHGRPGLGGLQQASTRRPTLYRLPMVLATLTQTVKRPKEQLYHQAHQPNHHCSTSNSRVKVYNNSNNNTSSSKHSTSSSGSSKQNSSRSLSPRESELRRKVLSRQQMALRRQELPTRARSHRAPLQPLIPRRADGSWRGRVRQIGACYRPRSLRPPTSRTCGGVGLCKLQKMVGYFTTTLPQRPRSGRCRKSSPRSWVNGRGWMKMGRIKRIGGMKFSGSQPGMTQGESRTSSRRRWRGISSSSSCTQKLGGTWTRSTTRAGLPSTTHAQVAPSRRSSTSFSTQRTWTLPTRQGPRHSIGQRDMVMEQ
mmetsp:Transcript_76807/g.167871  ORF Transcript_76807/g.167871 Transcript_76807/m.167871 type:complete len:370 (-) Transcript_76807:939-2048(-)